jgi:hypothetical protein
MAELRGGEKVWRFSVSRPVSFVDNVFLLRRRRHWTLDDTGIVTIHCFPIF